MKAIAGCKFSGTRQYVRPTRPARRNAAAALHRTAGRTGRGSGALSNRVCRRAGSVAAPTAGLHFTPELLDTIRARGVKICFVTLHVGAGTFLPVKAENVADHQMHAERFEIGDSHGCRRQRRQEIRPAGHRRGHHRHPRARNGGAAKRRKDSMFIRAKPISSFFRRPRFRSWTRC